MIDIIKFNSKIILKRNIFLKTLLCMPILAFVLTVPSYLSKSNLIEIGNPIFSYFFFDGNKSSILNIMIALLPILCAFVYGDYHYYEKASFHSILIRSKKRYQIFLSNAIFAFMCGFLIVVVFLAFMFLYNFIITNNNLHEVSYNSLFINENHSMVNEASYFSGLFLEHPYLDIFIQSIIISICGGLFSLTTYSVSLHCNSKLITYLSTMFFAMITMFLSAILPFSRSNWCIQMIISPDLTMIEYHLIVLLFWLLLFMVINVLLIYRKVVNKDGVV